MNLFEQLTDNQWRIKFFGSSPVMHTLREFTPLEREDIANEGLKGVRTYWFGANHLRGIPDMILQDENKNTTDWNDWAWVPKR